MPRWPADHKAMTATEYQRRWRTKKKVIEAAKFPEVSRIAELMAEVRQLRRALAKKRAAKR